MPRHRHSDEQRYIGMMQRYMLQPYFTDIHQSIVDSDDCWQAINSLERFAFADFSAYMFADRAPLNKQELYEELNNPLVKQDIPIEEKIKISHDFDDKIIAKNDYVDNPLVGQYVSIESKINKEKAKDNVVYVVRVINIVPLDPILFDTLGNVIIPRKEYIDEDIDYIDIGVDTDEDIDYIDIGKAIDENIGYIDISKAIDEDIDSNVPDTPENIIPRKELPDENNDKFIWLDQYGRVIVYIDSEGTEYYDWRKADIELQTSYEVEEHAGVFLNPYNYPTITEQSGFINFNMSIPEKVVRQHLLTLDTWHYAQSLVEYRKLLIHDFAIANTSSLDTLEQWLDDWIITNKNFVNTLIPQASDNIRNALIANCLTEPFNGEIATRVLNSVYRNSSYLVRQFAITQTRNAVGRLTNMRQTGVGIRRYKWLTSHDAVVRDSHQALDGQIIAWEGAPYIGHPGYDINCRCTAIPVL